MAAAYGRPAGDESEESDDDFAFFTPNAHQNQKSLNDSKPLVPEVARRVGQNRSLGTRPNRRASCEESQMLENYRLGAMKGQLDTIKQIVQSGVNVDQILKCNWTALMYACSSGHVEIVSYLLKNEADANFHKASFTPLMTLCSSKCENEDDLVSCARLLVQHGAHVNCHEKQHLVTPLMFAARGDRKNVVKVLLELGAEIDAQDNRGWTALSWAANGGQKEMVQLLLDAKADPTKACPNGQLASDLASEKGYTEIVHLLEEACRQNNLPVPDLSPAVPKVSLRNCSSPQDTKVSSQPKVVSPKTNSTCVLRESTKNYTKYGDLELFLAGLELSHLLSLFQENNFDFQAFLSTTDDELEKIGVTSVGHRKKILGAIGEVHKKEWEKSSLPAIQQKKTISCPEVNAIVENITKHISYINATIKYLSKEVSIRPDNLELGKEAVSVASLSDQTSLALHSVKNLEDELQRMKWKLDKVKKRVEHIPADLIEAKKPPSCDVHFSLRAKALLAGIVVVGLVCARPFMVHKLTCLSFKD